MNETLRHQTPNPPGEDQLSFVQGDKGERYFFKGDDLVRIDAAQRSDADAVKAEPPVPRLASIRVEQ